MRKLNNPTIHVTFDRNVAIEIWRVAQQDNIQGSDYCAVLLAAIKDGRIKPYIPEATLTFELFNIEDRLLILRRQFATDGRKVDMPKVSLHQAKWVEQLLEIGFRIIRQPPRVSLAAFMSVPKDAWAEDIYFTREERINR